MTPEEMAGRCGEWLKGCGPESDIVMSSRIRLARNLADYPFIRRCTDIDRANIESTVRERLSKDERLTDLTFINVADLESLDRQFLVERQLISREHANSDGARAVAIDQQERLSLMVNEEDHLRIQVMKSGLDLAGAWDQINELDDRIESRVTYAFHPKLEFSNIRTKSIILEHFLYKIKPGDPPAPESSRIKYGLLFSKGIEVGVWVSGELRIEHIQTNTRRYTIDTGHSFEQRLAYFEA